MRLLDSDLRWYRDRLVALSACALVALSLAFGLVPSTARATTLPSCSGLDGAQGPLFFIPSSNSDASLQPTPASGSTVAALSTVYAVYHDETDLGTGHNLTFTYTGPTSGTVTPIFTTLTAGTGFSTMLPSDGDAWIPLAGRGIEDTADDVLHPDDDAHPDQEFDHVVKISGVIPNLTTSGDYLFHLQTFDGDNNSQAGDCGFAEWNLHVKAKPDISTTPSAGGPVGTAIHDTASVTGGQSPTGNVTFNLYAPSDPNCDSTAVFTDTQNLGVVSGNYTTAAVGTYHWKATYNGDANNVAVTSLCSDETVTITKAQPSISTTPSAGGPVGTAIHDAASVTGGHSPTGNVTFNLYAPGDATCASAAIFTDTQNLGVVSGDYTTAAVGTYHWKATYNGDPNNLSVTSLCSDETVTTTKAQPSISTTPSAGGPIGTAIHDAASVTGGHSPTGNVTFNLYAPGDATCASAAIFTDTQNLGVVSGDYTTAAVGTYHWKATYNGDANNVAVTSLCSDETVTTTKAQPSISTTPSAGGTVGTVIQDTASVTGGHSPTGTVTFNLYAPGDLSCESAPLFTDTEALGVASGNYTTVAVGIYRWTATYNGDATNLPVTSGCQDEQVTTTKANGTIATVAAGANLVAGTAGVVSDQATFSGAYHPTGDVVFTLYNADCSQSTGITGSGAISNAGTASFSSAWTPAAAGTYNWKATYAGDANNAAFATGCHDANEQVTVSNPPASGTQSASTGGVNAATTLQPNTGHSDFARNMFLAMVMVLLGITALAGQVLFTSMKKEEL